MVALVMPDLDAWVFGPFETPELAAEFVEADQFPEKCNHVSVLPITEVVRIEPTEKTP